MYVDAFHDRETDTIRVVERVNGQRLYNDLPAEYVFYHEHPAGRHRSIYGHSLRKEVFTDGRKFRTALAKKRDGGARIFESDINPVFRALHKHYSGADAPKLNLGFFDIEVDFDPKKGFAPTTDPFNAVTAISLHLSQTGKLHTLVLCPPTYTVAEAQKIVATFDDTELFEHEADLLDRFLTLIEDTDVLSGWNSEGFDIPYMVNRVKRILGEDAARRFCLWDQAPREREYVKFMRTFKTYELVGRVHLDYLLLYQKHNPQQQHSYRLDYIGEIEVGENKTPYEGTLDDLYKKDFPKFIAYNRQDTALLVKIDAKRKFIELANQIAHANTVILKTTMGSVALVEQAIINEMWAMGYQVPDRKPRPEDGKNDFADLDEDEEGRTPVVGAYVAKPKVGLHEQVGSVDLNSLYPSTIRALNMSPETVYGHIRPVATMELVQKRIAEGTPRAEAWEGLFSTIEVERMHAGDPDFMLTLDIEDHLKGTTKEVTMSAKQLRDFVFDPRNHVCITANGTLFRTDKDGIIPMLLAKWYADRKAMQKKQRDYEAKAKDATTEEEKKDALYWAGFWNQRQQARKILLNSLYGALLNAALRFHDERLGQSTTLTGRSIVRHMSAKINEIITGIYDPVGDAVNYGDTDSCYFSAATYLKALEAGTAAMPENGEPPFSADELRILLGTREDTIAFYDAVADAANASFPEFMDRNFHTGLERGAIIKAGREIVASRALFVKKKKYAALCYDTDGTRHDVDGKPGKLKAMGLDLKRADTPKFMQKFLEKMLMDLLKGVEKEVIYKDIKEFRNAFTSRPGWEKGSPKKVSDLTGYAEKAERANAIGLTDRLRPGQKLKVNMPGHVRASLNWNLLCDMHDDRYAMRITDGTRIIVCKLKPNAYKMDSVAYPIDEPHLPEWFKALPFDDDAMEETIVDMKIMNLVGVLEWDLTDTKERPGDEFFIFGEPEKPKDPRMDHNGGPAWDEDEDDD